MALTSLALIVLCLQTPVHGWGIARVPPGEVERIYWELLQTTEVLVRLVPVDPDGKPLRVDLVFQAFFPGRPERIGAAMQWPKGRPARLTVAAQAFPATFVIPELSLRLVMDGATVDLTGDAGRYRHLLPCPEGCTPNGVEADLEPAILRSLITARSVEGQALGFPIKLRPADQTVLADFAARIGLSVDQTDQHRPSETTSTTEADGRKPFTAGESSRVDSGAGIPSIRVASCRIPQAIAPAQAVLRATPPTITANWSRAYTRCVLSRARVCPAVPVSGQGSHASLTRRGT